MVLHDTRKFFRISVFLLLVISQFTVNAQCSSLVIDSCASDVTVDASANSCSYIVPDFTPSVQYTSDCAVSVTQSPNAGSSLAAGLHIVTVTVANGTLTATCDVTVNVIDNTPPVIGQCSPTQTAFLNQACQAIVPDFLAHSVATDSCGHITASQQPSTGSLVGEGNVAVNISAVDNNLNRVSCTSQLTVLDQIKPTISCQNRQVNIDSQCQGEVPNFASLATASDNCDKSLTITQSVAAGTKLSSGIHSIVVTARDNSGNTQSCTSVFTVVDPTNPSITCPTTSSNIAADINCIAYVPNFASSVTTSDNCGGSLNITQIPAASSLFNTAGTHKVDVTVRDTYGNPNTCSVNVVVQDNSPPVISTCSPLKKVVANDKCQASMPNLLSDSVFSDTCGSIASSTQSVAANSVISVGSHQVTITVKDPAGNTATCQSNVVVEDKTAPGINCPASVPSVTVQNSADTVSIPDVKSLVTIQDNCDTSSTITVVQSPSAGTKVSVGSHSLSVNVSDKAGNIATCTIPFEVKSGSGSSTSDNHDSENSAVGLSGSFVLISIIFSLVLQFIL